MEGEQSDHYDTWRTLRLLGLDEVSRGVFVSVLYPVAKGQAVPVVSRVEGDGYEGARVGDGDVLLLAEEDSDVDDEGISTDAHLVAVRRDGGATQWFLAVGATRVALDGVEVFRADSLVTVALDSARTGCLVAEQRTHATISIGADRAETLDLEAGTTRLGPGDG